MEKIITQIKNVIEASEANLMSDIEAYSTIKKIWYSDYKITMPKNSKDEQELEKFIELAHIISAKYNT